MPNLRTPRGYKDIGETLAAAVVFAGQSRRWAVECTQLFGYQRTDLDAWIEHFRQKKKKQIERFQRETAVLSAKKTKREGTEGQAPDGLVRKKGQELKRQIVDSLAKSQLELTSKRVLGLYRPPPPTKTNDNSKQQSHSIQSRRGGC
jgi:hypothetical protein